MVFITALSKVLPIFLLILLGVVLRRLQVIRPDTVVHFLSSIRRVDDHRSLDNWPLCVARGREACEWRSISPLTDLVNPDWPVRSANQEGCYGETERTNTGRQIVCRPVHSSRDGSFET